MQSIESPLLQSISGMRHGFFGRDGGVSDGLYASLNCGYGSGDDPVKVTENRRRVAAALGSRAPLLTCFQTHSADVVTVTAPWAWQDSPQADAMVTDLPGIPLGVLTADCLPVLFADRRVRVIGAAHAGWKGALGGVLEATMTAMQRLGARDVVASIGPAIQQASYEVGAEFRATFLAASEETERYFSPSETAGKYYFNLPEYARDRLLAAGIAQAEILSYDTRALKEDFFSFRRATLRAESVYGRQVGALILE